VERVGPRGSVLEDPKLSRHRVDWMVPCQHGPPSVIIESTLDEQAQPPMRQRLRPASRTAISRTSLGRLGQTSEVARCVQFLLGDEAGYIAGAVVTVHGGPEVEGNETFRRQ
jgi:hypothetical protein